MRAFIDFEASSLARHSYPIEVAWVFENGAAESFLIKPAEAWTDWDPVAEKIHGISRAQLAEEGIASEVVARRLVEALCDHEVCASAPSWDGKWLSRLLRAAGLPRHAIRLNNTELALAELAGALLAPMMPSGHIPRATRQILAEVEQRFAEYTPAHRALPDARHERERWLSVSELATALDGIG